MVMIALSTLLHVFSKNEETNRTSFFLTSPEEGKLESVWSSHLFPMLCRAPDQNHILHKEKRKTMEVFIWLLHKYPQRPDSSQESC